MGFTILDNDEVFHPDQARWMQTDINALIQGMNGEGVLTGCGVTAQGPPDMTVAVASGTIQIARALVTVGAGNVTITAANGTNPRIDLVAVDNSGTKSATAGTPAASPKAPDIPANSVLLAMVYVPAAIATITSNKITDKRVVIQPDYDGTWTPTILLGGTPVTSYFVQVGTYRRIGNLVSIQGYAQVNAVGGGSGAVTIGGLPIIHKTLANLYSVPATHGFGFANMTTESLQGRIASGAQVIDILKFASGTITTLLDTNIATNVGIMASCSYPVN